MVIALQECYKCQLPSLQTGVFDHLGLEPRQLLDEIAEYFKAIADPLVTLVE